MTWKGLVFVALKFPLGVASFAIVCATGFFSLVLLFAPLIVLVTTVTFFGWIVESPLQALPLVLIGAPAVLLSLHLYNGAAWLWALFARVMLGPSTVQLRERVDDLRDARARIIAAGDDERRRIERDLHDGAQQRLVALSLTLGLAESRLNDPAAAAPLIAQAREEARLAVQELRELASGIHPALLTDRGLGPGARGARRPRAGPHDGRRRARAPAPAARSRPPATSSPSEALTNVAKYAGAMSAGVSLAIEHGRVRLIVRDDGAGGADLNAGSGLRGLRDRVEALDGHLAHRLPARPRHDADRGDPAPMRRLAPPPPDLLVAGCGGGERIVETRQVAPFDRLEVSESVDVQVVPGDGREVRVAAGENVIDRVVTESSGGVLKIDIRDRGIVIGPDPLNDVEVAGPGVGARGAWTSRARATSRSRASTQQELELRVQGAGDVEASGTVDRLTATIQGAGDARLSQLRVRTARVVVQGAADAELNVSDELDVTVQGAGDVSYTRRPRRPLGHRGRRRPAPDRALKRETRAAARVSRRVLRGLA